MPTTTWTIPPEVCQYFNKYLLSMPIPKMYDDCEVLWGIYEYLILKIKPKCVKNSVWLAKIEKLEKKFLELYGRAKAKEIEFEKKTGKPIGTPFSYFRETNRRNPTILGKIRARGIYSNDSFI